MVGLGARSDPAVQDIVANLVMDLYRELSEAS